MSVERDSWHAASAAAVTSVNVVEIGVSFEVATDHAAMVAIWVGTASVAGVMSSVIGSVCM